VPDAVLNPLAPATLPELTPTEARPAARPRGAAIGSPAAALPPTAVGNAPIAARLGVDDRWIRERTGIVERRVAAPGDRLSDLAADAGARALARADLGAAELDLLLVATTTQDDVTPNAAPQVAARLGAAGAATIDVGAACTAFISAIALACGQIESGRARNALVIGADMLTRFVDPDDRRTAALFGDGAGAVVMGAAGDARVGPVILRADGAHADLIRAPREDPRLRMQGHDTFVHAVRRMSDVTLEAAGAAGLSLDEIDLFVYHQANARILRAVGERLELPPEKVVDCIARYGNTSAASIPIALAEAEAEGALRDGARVLLAAFGAGFTWGGTVVEWGAA
jgi:3-oxoacyl-[acyl-carrier-protein] synthase-3